MDLIARLALRSVMLQRMPEQADANDLIEILREAATALNDKDLEIAGMSRRRAHRPKSWPMNDTAPGRWPDTRQQKEILR